MRRLGRRAAGPAAVLLLVSLGVFALQDAAPGSTERMLLGSAPATEQAVEAVRERHGLADPFPVRYAQWLGNAATLDLGTSIRTGEPVLTLIGERGPLTLTLVLLAALVVVVVGVPLGIAAALRQGTWLDQAAVGIAIVGVSTPAFASGIFLLYVFGVELGWFPVSGAGSGFADRLWHLALPAFALAFTAIAYVVKLTRAGLIRTLDQDYIAFAVARGVSRPRVVLGYALRTSLIPVVTAAGLVLNLMLFGVVLVEVTFALPGLGSLLINAVAAQDVPTVQGIAVLMAVVVVALNLVVDAVYTVVDPRVRLGATP
jgi:peptide/nickel transport system permease protein